MPKLRLKKSEKLRDEIINERLQKIKELYQDAAKDIEKELTYYSKLDTATGALRTQQLNDLKNSLSKKLAEVNNEIAKGITDDVKKVSESVQGNMNKWLEKVGFGYSFANIPDSVVKDILFGDVYNKKNYLSKRIWNITQKELDDINAIVAKGIAENKGIYDIAKDLEKYVNPSAKKDWDWSKVYPGTNKKVDYNAQRLARTLSQHAFQRSFEKAAEKNPFVEGYIWLSANAHGRTCEVCRNRDGKFFKKGELPLDHPNGLCTWELKMKSTTDIGKSIEDWYDAPEGTYPEIDAFAKSLEKKYSSFVNSKQGIKEVVKSNIVNGNPNAINDWVRRSDEFEFDIEDAINYQGFDGLPRVVNKEEFNKLVKESKFIAQRTYGASSKEVLDAYREQLYKGKWYVDCSAGGAAYGKGMYCAADWTGKLSDGVLSEMKRYKDLNIGKGYNFNYVETFTFDKNAKIVAYDDLFKMKTDYKNIKQKEFIESIDAPSSVKDMLWVKAGYATNEQFDNVLTEYFKLSQEERKARDEMVNKYISDSLKYAEEQNARIENMDIGSFAALLGYDAIDAQGRNVSGSYVVILNRTKLIILGGN